jgi:hypothetical protein
MIGWMDDQRSKGKEDGQKPKRRKKKRKKKKRINFGGSVKKATRYPANETEGNETPLSTLLQPPLSFSQLVSSY